MNLYDLRRDRVNPKDFEGIISPFITKRLAKERYHIDRSINDVLSGVYAGGYRRKYGLNKSSPRGLYEQSEEKRLERDVDSGYIILTERRENRSDGFRYPFYISEGGELFCSKPDYYNHCYIRNVLSFYPSNILIFGNPQPTRSNYIPVTQCFGPGFWRTVDDDFHSLKNFGVMTINRMTSMGDEGRIFMSEGKDFMHTSRDKIQEWTPLPDNLEQGNKEIIFNRSVIRRFGERRNIYQHYQEGDDAWAREGKSWHWMPTISDENYEFKK